jgi:signal transduction histidine kinase
MMIAAEFPPQNTLLEQNFFRLRVFIWSASILALLPFWGNAFLSPNSVMVQVMYSAWTTFVIFVMALGTTFYLQRHLDTTILLQHSQWQAQQEARMRLQQLNALLVMSPDGVVAFDAQQKVQFVNPAFVRISGLSEYQLQGLSHELFTELLAKRCVPPAVFPGIQAMTESMTRIKIELAGAGKFLLQVELVRANAVLSETNSPLSMLLYFRDVTFDTQLEQDKTDFLATAAHELRTPMASVYGFAEVLLMQENDAVAQREFLEIIYRQSQHMVKIINDLLDLARIEARKAQDFVFTRLPVQDIVNDVVRHFKLPEERQAPALSLPLEPVYIKADSGKLHQALQNVLCNAYKYSSGSGKVQISVQLHSARQVSISIRDEGIGMTQQQVSKVFTRFYRADTVAALPGTGLGMNIVKEIVKSHSGDVLIDSALGVGTRVSLIFPVDIE